MATQPFQVALSTLAGADALAHIVRLLTEGDESKVILSLDGFGAFEQIGRAHV